METLHYSNSFLPIPSCIATESFRPLTRSHHHHLPPTSPHPIPATQTRLQCDEGNMFKYAASSPPFGLSPVSTISTTLHSLAVESPPKVTTPTLQRTSRTNTVRRNLSLSLDCITKAVEAAQAEEEDPFRPKTPELAFPFDTEVIVSPPTPVLPESTSPYKSPKRARSQDNIHEDLCCEDGDEELESETPLDMDHIKEDMLLKVLSAPTPLMRSSSAHILMGGEKDKKKGRARSLLMYSEDCITRLKESQPECILPTVSSGSHPDLAFISPRTVVDLMEGKYSTSIAEYFIIDCRFPYEFDGGHIKTALNLTENQMKQMFIDNPITHKKIAIIFHCEFSSQRAPRCCRFLRELDRKLNIAEYPKLFYPDVYVIEGGYKKFFETHKDYCDGTYIEMRDERHAVEMKAHCGKLRTIKRARSLSADCFSSLVAQSNTPKYG